MKRQAFINWERVTEDNKPENHKSYMVAEIVEEDVAKLGFATWYDKGTVVDIPLKESKNKAEMTAEERLLQCIFGSYKEYTVPKSGFYILTGDYGIDESIEDGAFEGCTQMLIDLSDDIYFAEEPLAPEGYLTEYQDKQRMQAKSKQVKAAMHEEKINDIKSVMDDNECVKNVIDSLAGENWSSEDVMITERYGYGIYTLSAMDISENVIEANSAINALINLINEEGGIETVATTLREALKSKTYRDCLAQMLNRESLKDISWKVKRCLTIYLESIVVNYDFYHYRNRFAKQFEDPAQVMIASQAANSIVNRLDRCWKLRTFKAPIVIQTEELKLFTKSLIAFTNIRKLEGVADEFEQEFGVDKNGLAVDIPNALGDFENQIGCDDYDDENKSEPEDRYFIVPSPNYAYKNGKYALWNPKIERYYRENGQVVVFASWKDARDKREIINK